MILRSHICLWINCKAEEASEITAQLGIEPSEIRECPITQRQPDGTMAQKDCHAWVMNSPMSAEAGDPTARLSALAEVIRPFGDRLVSLDPRWRRWIDIAYWVTPQRPTGITGEFNWFRLPVKLMKDLSNWELHLSYEVFWHDHPNWKVPRKSWWRSPRRSPKKVV